MPGLESYDGIKWAKPANSLFMKKRLIFNSGDTINVRHLERPQLLIDKDGNPLVIYAACSLGSVGKKKDGSTFNVHIPLKADN